MTTFFPRRLAARLGVRRASRKKVRWQPIDRNARVRWAQPFPRKQQRPARVDRVYQARRFREACGPENPFVSSRPQSELDHEDRRQCLASLSARCYSQVNGGMIEDALD